MKGHGNERRVPETLRCSPLCARSFVRQFTVNSVDFHDFWSMYIVVCSECQKQHANKETFQNHERGVHEFQ
jgi:hypothetical protein